MECRSPGNLDDCETHGYSRSDALLPNPVERRSVFNLLEPLHPHGAIIATRPTRPCFSNGQRLPPITTCDVRSPSQTAPTTELIFPHSLHTASSNTNNLSTDFAIKLRKPRPTPDGFVILPRILTCVYLDIELPSRSWNAIQLPMTSR